MRGCKREFALVKKLDFHALMNLLIVDDNPVMRSFLRRIVSVLAATVREASDGSEAVARYREQSADLVLMDIRMPVMDGIEATARIVEADPRAIVFIVTDFDEAVLRDKARAAGACAYILKEDLPSLPNLIPMHLTAQSSDSRESPS
jgi:CheY-like chemotaxis protein